MKLHYAHLEHTLHRPDVIKKGIKLRKTPEFRKKMRKKMLTMKDELSERAKKQWEDDEYKEFMMQKWKEFYESTPEYQEENAPWRFPCTSSTS